MNQTHIHPGQPQMQAEVILASRTDTGAPPIYTIRLRYPRIIHGELMTHRVFSRNAGSSRARPAKVTIQEVIEKPFIPWHWQKNQPGMQGKVYLSLDEERDARERWLSACNDAVAHANFMSRESGLNLHKQIFNRLLEPFSWIDVLVTATDWSNFLWLRDHEDAEPHIRDLAVLVKQAMDSAEMQELKPGEWHLPYASNGMDYVEAVEFAQANQWSETEVLQKISAARCARISYKPFGSNTASIEKDLQLYDKLVGADRLHASPLEHQATPDIIEHTRLTDEDGFVLTGEGWQKPELHGNLTGWIQYRKTVPGENYA